MKKKHSRKANLKSLANNPLANTIHSSPPASRQNHSEILPPNENGTAVAKELRLQQMQFSGPLPPPNLLDAYEKAHPGLAAKIITFAEQEANHRRAMERIAMDADVGAQNKIFQEANRGQNYALIIGLFSIAAGTFAAIMGAEIAGGFIGSTGVVGLVTAFIIGRRPPVRDDQSNALAEQNQKP